MNERPSFDDEQACRLICEVLASIAPDVDPDGISPEADLQQAADLDSMDFMSLVEGIAAKLGVDIPEDDYPRMATLSSSIAYVGERLSAGHPR